MQVRFTVTISKTIMEDICQKNYVTKFRSKREWAIWKYDSVERCDSVYYWIIGKG